MIIKIDTNKYINIRYVTYMYVSITGEYIVELVNNQSFRVPKEVFENIIKYHDKKTS